MNKKRLMPRIIALPFMMCILVIPMLILYFRWLKNFFLFGGEIIAYQDKEEGQTIQQVYQLIKDQKNNKT